MMTSFDKLYSQYVEENIGGNTGVKNPTTSTTTMNTNFVGSTEKPTEPQGTEDTQQKPTEPNKTVNPEEIMKSLNDLKDNPEFLNVVQKALDELQKKGQQSQFIQQQQNAANQPS